LNSHTFQIQLRKEAEVATFEEVLQDYTKKPQVPLAAKREQAKQNRLSLPRRPQHNAYGDGDGYEEDYGNDNGEEDYNNYENGYDNNYENRNEFPADDGQYEGPEHQEHLRRRSSGRAEVRAGAPGDPAPPPLSPTTGRISMLQSAAAGVPGVHDPFGPKGGPLTSPIVPIGGKLLSAAAAPPSMQDMMTGGVGNWRGGNPTMNRPQANTNSSQSRALVVLPARRQSFGAKRLTPFEDASQAMQGPTTPAQFFAQLASKVRMHLCLIWCTGLWAVYDLDQTLMSLKSSFNNDFLDVCSV